MTEPTLETNEPEEEEEEEKKRSKNTKRVYTELRKRINDLMGFVKRTARLTKDMRESQREKVGKEYRKLTDAIWDELRDLHPDGCLCDDCHLKRVFEDR